MARMPRLYIEGCAQHIVQRGNNRSVCFFDTPDYAFYCQKLKDAAERNNVQVHAFVLMANHVHLLVTPSDATGVARMMQALGRNYVRYINLPINAQALCGRGVINRHWWHRMIIFLQ